jgi:hypothetical protein
LKRSKDQKPEEERAMSTAARELEELVNNF